MLKKLITRFKKSPPDELYMDMRNQAFRLDPKTLGIEQSRETPMVWGVVTDFSIDSGFATLVSFANGRSHMYFSSGTGFLGAGDYKKVSKAAATLVSIAERHLSLMEKTEEFPLPRHGYVRFYLLTFAGVYTQEVPETIPLDDRTHPMYGLYSYAHNVIRQIRLAEKK